MCFMPKTYWLQISYWGTTGKHSKLWPFRWDLPVGINLEISHIVWAPSTFQELPGCDSVIMSSCLIKYSIIQNININCSRGDLVSPQLPAGKGHRVPLMLVLLIYSLPPSAWPSAPIVKYTTWSSLPFLALCIPSDREPPSNPVHCEQHLCFFPLAQPNNRYFSCYPPLLPLRFISLSPVVSDDPLWFSSTPNTANPTSSDSLADSSTKPFSSGCCF